MASFELNAIAPDQLPDELLTNRRALKDLVASEVVTDTDSTGAALDSVLKLSLDGASIATWPQTVVIPFITGVARHGHAALVDSKTTSISDDSIGRLRALSDLLVALATSRSSDIPADAKLWACRYWSAARLRTGVPLYESQTFVDQAVVGLGILGLSEHELRSTIQAETLAYISSRLSTTIAPDASVAWNDVPPSDKSPKSGEPGRSIAVTVAQKASSQASQDGQEISADRLTTTPPPPPPASKQSRRPIRVWESRFLSEQEAIEAIPLCIGDTIRLYEGLPTISDPFLQKLRGLERDADAHDATSSFTAPFIGTVSECAADVAAHLLDADRFHDAFRVCNAFAEIAKIAVAYNRKTYEKVFERLLLLACRTVARSRVPDDDTAAPPSVAHEIERLLSDLVNILRKALGTHFRPNERDFSYARIDASQVDRLANNVVAAYFDQRLTYVLERNRPQVKEFVRSNLPIVYRLTLSPDWTRRKRDWRALIEQSGYADVINSLLELGDLIDPAEIGKVPDKYRDDITAASARNDYARVIELLHDTANELRAYLFSEAQRLLQYRAPTRPQVASFKVREQFERARALARSTDDERLKSALREMQAAWTSDIDNIGLQDWVAYLQARTGNLVSAATNFERVQARRERRNFVTDWNLAVARYERKDEAGAYQLLLPLVEATDNDGDFITVVLALALKRNDKKTFLSVLPRTMSLRYHPLAVCLAHELGDRTRVESLVAQLVGQWRGTWDLPPVDQRFQSLDDLRQNAVNRAIAEGMVDEVIFWLEQRIKRVKAWVPNYQALASVHETVTLKHEMAFSALERRLDMAVRRRPASLDVSASEQLRYQRGIDDACDELLSFCRRIARADFGERAFRISETAEARRELLDSFSEFAPRGQQQPQEERSQPTVRVLTSPPPPPQDPKLADRIMWVNAGLVKIRNVSTYLEKLKEIEELTKIAAEVGPSESADALSIVKNISAILETFSKTADSPEDRSARRTLYARVVAHEKQLSQLLNQNALSTQLANLFTPLRQALQHVVGDLSRLAGVGPDVDAALENLFLSRDVPQSTLVFRVTDRSERPVTDITVEVVSETPSVLLRGPRRWTIPKLEAQRSELLPVSVEMVQAAVQSADEAAFAVSLRASAEGSPDVDLPIKKVSVPFRHFAEVVGTDQLPKGFTEAPLNPTHQVFHGRTPLLNQIKSSFSSGTQGQRYFFDGIRRVGKTSLLNFLPSYLPESVFPVTVNFDKHPIPHFSSAIALEKFASIIATEAATKLGVYIDIPGRPNFTDDPGQAFATFLGAFRSACPNRTPLLLIDEFQELLSAISRSGDGRNRDTAVLDLLRGHLDDGSLFAIFTGSVRFERLATYAGGEVRIFGSLSELPVSFLSPESVRDVLMAGMSPWGSVAPETAAAVFDWTGGYPWLVQKYGLELVRILNDEHRTIATPRDVEVVTNDRILPTDSLFKFWWDADQLKSDEERLVERLLRQQATDQPVRKQAFFADVMSRERERFRNAFDNLKACEVLDSRQPDYLRFGGRALQRWLEQHVEDGQLRIPRATEGLPIRGKAGIFIDHENMFHSLREISASRGVRVPETDTREHLQWFSGILGSLLEFAERQLGRPRSELAKVAVAFWNRSAEAKLSAVYHEYGFSVALPVQTDKGNEVDFKLADEIRRAREQANREGTVLSHAIIVTGDVDLSHATQALKNDGVAVHVIAGSKNTGDKYILLVGRENFVALQDVSGL